MFSWLFICGTIWLYCGTIWLYCGTIWLFCGTIWLYYGTKWLGTIWPWNDLTVYIVWNNQHENIRTFHPLYRSLPFPALSPSCGDFLLKFTICWSLPLFQRSRCNLSALTWVEFLECPSKRTEQIANVQVNKLDRPIHLSFFRSNLHSAQFLPLD